MKCLRLPVFLSLLLTLAMSNVGHAAPKVEVRVTSPEPRLAYGLVECDVTVTGGASPYKNPFDPDEVIVGANLIGPNGPVRVLSAYWDIPHKIENGWPVPTGEPGRFRLRFAPNTEGTWILSVYAKDKSGVSTPVNTSLAVQTGKQPGFVRRAKNSSRYFAFDNGKPYFLVGENVCWAGKTGLPEYETWFENLGKAGGNFARLWMAWQPLESKETGLGQYDLKSANYFDKVLEIAARNGIYCMMAFGTYGEFTTGGYFNEGKWPVNPYNAANGGPVPTDKPTEFFTNETARKHYRNRLRYLIARYGAYTSLAFWEFWNETAGPASWFSEMARYLKTNDPYQHLVTNSYSTTGEASVWNIPEIDLTQTHRYGDEGSVRDISPLMIADSRAHEVYGKPHLMGEFGISWRGPDDKFDPNGTATNVHNGLWSAALSGQAGGGAVWWWDNYIHPRNLYGVFTGLSKFAARVNWPARDFRPVALATPVRVVRTPETFTDAALSADGAWGYGQQSPATLTPAGEISGDPLPGFLYGPEKPDLHKPAALIVSLDKPSRIRVKVLTVSNKARLKITVNGKLAGEFPFDASPTGPKGYESTKQFPEYGGIYQALFNKEVAVPLPAGKSTITLENSAGDWVSIGPVTVEKARSSRYPALRTLALQDQHSGETILWIQDTDSNWYNDRAGWKPMDWSGVTTATPVPKEGRYHIVWWHTREGRVITEQTTSSKEKRLPLTPPLFSRDIAAQVTYEGG